MDGRTNNKGNKGNKGGGRPALTDEYIRAAVIDKSWDILLKFLEDKKIPDREKRQIALEIAKKTIPQHIDGNLSGNLQITWATESLQFPTPQESISTNSTNQAAGG